MQDIELRNLQIEKSRGNIWTKKRLKWNYITQTTEYTDVVIDTKGIDIWWYKNGNRSSSGPPDYSHYIDIILKFINKESNNDSIN